VLALLAEYLDAHPQPRPVKLYQAQAKRLFWVNEPWRERDLARVRAVGDAVKVRGEVVAEVGTGVRDREAFARVLARFLAALPSTFADRQDLDRVPSDEAGWLAFGAHLDAAEQGVRDRQARVEAIGREIDDLAWGLYRARPGTSPATRPPRGLREPVGPLL